MGQIALFIEYLCLQALGITLVFNLKIDNYDPLGQRNGPVSMLIKSCSTGSFEVELFKIFKWAAMRRTAWGLCVPRAAISWLFLMDAIVFRGTVISKTGSLVISSGACSDFCYTEKPLFKSDPHHPKGVTLVIFHRHSDPWRFSHRRYS